MTDDQDPPVVDDDEPQSTEEPVKTPETEPDIED